MSLIRVEELVKGYGRNIAVDHLSFEIQEGEIFGLLGPNGAGKSTTINLICGLLKMDSGDIWINGRSVREAPLEVKGQIGLVPQEIALFDVLTAQENIMFFGRLAGLKGELLESRTHEALALVGLSESADRKPRTFSGGMKRRLNIACSIVHQPRIIIMDEPTVGIDPQSRNHILDSVRRLNELGSTIIYTSHYMEEVEVLCNRIAIMDHGRLIALGTKEDLKKLAAREERILIRGDHLNYNILGEIKGLFGVKDVQLNDDVLEIVTDEAQTLLQDVFFILSKNEARIHEIQLAAPNLETVFLTLTGRSLRD